MFNPRAYANSRHNGTAVLEIPEGRRAGKLRQFVPLKRTTVGGVILGPLAELTITHTYGYTKAQCAQTLEAVYRFPLPGDAAVQRITVSFGDAEICAELKEREQAEADYAEARGQGRQAALVTRESPDAFTLLVTGIRPDEDITVETCYVQLANPEGAGWTLRIPLTTAPRYSRSDERASRRAQGQPVLTTRDPGHRFALDILMPGVSEVASSTHQLELGEEDGRTRVRLLDREVLPDRDCMLTWQPPRQRNEPGLHIFLAEDEASGQSYFLALVAPPVVVSPDRHVPREAIVLVDHSGSMAGAKWAAADWAVLRFIGDLGEEDGFNLGVFESKTRWLGKWPRLASGDAVAVAERFLKAEPDGGGTELGVALEQALRQPRHPGGHSRNVVIVTDAQVTDSARLIRLVEREARHKDRRRVSVLCIDAAPNSFLVHELAKRGGGVARFVTSTPDEGDITTALDEILADFGQPVLAGLRLEVNRAAVEAAERAVIAADGAGWGAIDLGDLPAGRAIWIVGRAPTGDGANLAFRLRDANGQEVAAWRTKSAGASLSALKALFGAWRVLGLENLVESGRPENELRELLAWLGYDPAAALSGAAARGAPLYHENARAEAEGALRGLLVREALGYGLLCSATGFVAVRKESGKLIEGTVPVASALPSGWSDDFATAGKASYAMFAPADAMAPAASPPSRAKVLFDRLGGGGRGHAAPAPPPDRAADELMVSAFLGQVETYSAHEVPRQHGPAILFDGPLPPITGGQKVLFDTDRRQDAARLPDAGAFSLLRLAFPDGAPDPTQVDPGLTLLLFVGDMAVPAVKVRLVDMLRQGGQRPVSIVRQYGGRMMLALSDPAGVWARQGPRIAISIE